MSGLESQIAEWRAFVGRAPGVDGHEVEELEDHLRHQVAELHAAGLSDDEAFLVAVKRLGEVDAVAREYARENSGRLWKQLLRDDDVSSASAAWLPALLFAAGASLALVAARLVADAADEEPAWFARNVGLFVLPFLAAYLLHRRGLGPRAWLLTAVPFVLAGLVINLYPWDAGTGAELLGASASDTEVLAALHLPVVLWFVVALPYMGGTLRLHERRMDFVRFTGEWFVYYALIALGGGVLMALTAAVLEPTGIDVERVLELVLTAGVAGAVVVAAWLVEAKQRVVENMAPVLTMLFTPLFALMLAVAAVAYVATVPGDTFDRELLTVFDALLVVVLALVLYAISAREASSTPGWMDRIQLVAVGCALVLDVLVLGSMISRIGDLGFTPNRTVALGLNLVLLVNLTGAAVLSVRFLSGRSTLHRLERWQTGYLPVFALWAAAVVAVIPPLFGFA